MKKIKLLLLYTGLAIMPFGLFSQQIITTVPALNAIEGDTVIVPITVENFNGVASISIVLSYNTSVLQYLGYQNAHPSLTFGMFVPGGIPPLFKLAWFSTTTSSIGTGTMVELRFLALASGISPLTWDTITQGNCEYSDFIGDKIPASFNNGSVSVESLARGFHGKVFLQAPYNAGTGAMNTNLANLGLLPVNQPYNTAPWNYTGAETLDTIPDGMVDWVIVELRSAADMTSLVERRAAILMSDGSILDLDMGKEIAFDSSGMFYVVVDHRNHMPVMTATPVSIPDTNFVDLSTDGAAVYGSGARISLGTNVNAMISGDVTKNGQLKYSGSGNDRSPILTQIIAQTGTTAINTIIQGYYKEDVSMDGTVKYSGGSNDPSRIISNLVILTGSQSINVVHNCPVPQVQ